MYFIRPELLLPLTFVRGRFLARGEHFSTHNPASPTALLVVPLHRCVMGARRSPKWLVLNAGPACDSPYTYLVAIAGYYR